MRFKSSAFQVNKEDPFSNDQFGRKPIVEFLAQIIEKSGGPFVLALDSPWGTGKTATVQMLKAYLEAEAFMCVYFDAWRADYVSDPLVAMLGTMEQLDFSKKPIPNQHFKAAKKLAASIGRRIVVGGVRAASAGIVNIDDYDELVKDLASGATEDLIQTFNQEQEDLEKVRKELERAVHSLQEVEGTKKTLVFFIDELDRCRPDFALSVLERMKHLFDLADIHFVLSIDKKQLESSVSAIHGAKINSSEYLRRFFDLEFGLPDGDSRAYTAFLIKDLGLEEYFAGREGRLSNDRNYFIENFSAMADMFSLSLRARDKCLTRLVVVISQTEPNEDLDPELIAFLIILRSMDPDYFTQVAVGSVSAKAMSEYIRSKPGGADYMSQHKGSILYGLLIAHHSNQEFWRTESLELSNRFHALAGGTDEEEFRWVDSAMGIFREFGGSGTRRTIRSMAAKIDLTARLSK